MPYLLCLEGHNEGEEWTVGDRPAIIGRSPQAEAIIFDMKVSRKHARIFKNGNRHFIEDLGSTNGTFVDREKISKPTLLQNEQFFQVGDSLFLFTEVSLRQKASSSIYQIGAAVFEKGEEYKAVMSNIVQEIIQKKKVLPPPDKQAKPGTLRWLLRGLHEEEKKEGKKGH